MHVMQCFIQFGNGGYEMKKIFIILCCFGILSAHATEMCARDDTVVIPLDATINPTVNVTTTYNPTEWLWWMVFDYGTIYGAAACVSDKEIMMYSDWNGTGYPPNVLNTASDELIGASGYYMNADSNSDIPDEEKNNYARRWCYGKLTHPMSSSWIFSTVNINTETSCFNSCNQRFGFQYYANRLILFNSIGTTPPWPLE